MSAVRERVALARQVDLLELKVRRKKCDIGWLKKTAKEMDILIDDQSDFSEADLYDSDDDASMERSKKHRELKQKRQQLKKMLANPIFPKGFSYKYPSSSSIDLALAPNANDKELNLNNIDISSKNNAVDVMKNAIQEYKLEKKQRNKKIKY